MGAIPGTATPSIVRFCEGCARTSGGGADEVDCDATAPSGCCISGGGWLVGRSDGNKPPGGGTPMIVPTPKGCLGGRERAAVWCTGSTVGAGLKTFCAAGDRSCEDGGMMPSIVFTKGDWLVALCVGDAGAGDADAVCTKGDWLVVRCVGDAGAGDAVACCVGGMMPNIVFRTGEFMVAFCAG